MAGIYIHIPFCKQRCYYCDFYTTTLLKNKPAFIDALKKELSLRHFDYSGETTETVYFGGGTPSLLTVEEITSLLDEINKYFAVDSTAEITLEANPDDLNKEYLSQLRTIGINRLSIGVQSFHDADLKTMNRRHTAQQAVDCVKTAQDSGFNNISIDLIYGLPNSSPDLWLQNLENTRLLGVQHLSAYHLTYESGTVFDNWIKNKKITPIAEEDSLWQFQTLMKWASENSFEQYEISNFALPGYYSRHNTSYWQQKKYLGLGPSAHSYSMDNRCWNISDVSKYISSLAANKLPLDCEKLTINDRFNDFIITTLRTAWGTSLGEIKKQFGERYVNHLLDKAIPFIKNNQLTEKNESLVLTPEGVFISDYIFTELIITEDD